MILSANDFEQNTIILKSKNLLDKDVSNWLKDNFVIAFANVDFNVGDVIRTIQEHPKFSKNITNWRSVPRESAMVFCVTSKEQEVIVQNINKNAFKQFLCENLNNPKYKNKYLAFVNGIFQDYGDKRTKLVHTMYQKFGNVKMYVGKVTSEKTKGIIDSPELR